MVWHAVESVEATNLQNSTAERPESATGLDVQSGFMQSGSTEGARLAVKGGLAATTCAPCTPSLRSFGADEGA